MKISIDNFRNITSKTIEVQDLYKLGDNNKTSFINGIIFGLYGDVNEIENNISPFNKSKTTIEINEPRINWLKAIYSLAIKRTYDNNSSNLVLTMKTIVQNKQE